jgi:hypothetical protein
VQNPLGSEDAAFRWLIGVVVLMAAIVAVVMLVRAVS